MKRLFSSLFGGSSKTEKQEDTVRSKYMPAEETPIEEAFTLKFTEQGGKFIYCEDKKESVNVFKSILAENGWNDCEMLCFRPKLQERYIRPSITPTKTNLNARFFLTDCEFLVAHDGSIIICAEQIANHKLIDLPENFVIVAGTKQLTDNLSEGLKGIKHKYKKNIPINITSIKHFKKNITEGDDTFLTYGLPIKHVYLILIEDF